MRLTEVSCSDAIRRSEHGCSLVRCGVEDESRPFGKMRTPDVSIRNVVGLQSHVDKSQSVLVDGIVNVEFLDVIQTSVVLMSTLPKGPATTFSKQCMKRREELDLRDVRNPVERGQLAGRDLINAPEKHSTLFRRSNVEEREYSIVDIDTHLHDGISHLGC